MKSLHIVYGFQQEKFIQDIENKLKEKYEHLERVIKYSKEAITEYLINHPECNTLVLLETNGTVSYEAEEIAEYMDIRELNIVVMLNVKHKGTEYMRTLYAAGIMNAIFDTGTGVKSEKIAELILEKRDRVRARTYYGIAGLNSLQKILTTKELQNMTDCLYDSSYGTSVAERYIKLARSLSMENNKKVWDFIPDELKNEIVKYEEFYEIVDLMKRAGYKIRYPKVPKKELKSILNVAEIETKEEKYVENYQKEEKEENISDAELEEEYDEEIGKLFKEETEEEYDEEIRDLFQHGPSKKNYEHKKKEKKRKEEEQIVKNNKNYDITEDFDKNDKEEFTVYTILGIIGLFLVILFLVGLIFFVASKGTSSNEAMQAYLESNRNNTEIGEYTQEELYTEVLENEEMEGGNEAEIDEQIDSPIIVSNSLDNSESGDNEQTASANHEEEQDSSSQNSDAEDLQGNSSSDRNKEEIKNSVVTNSSANNNTSQTTETSGSTSYTTAQQEESGVNYDYIPELKNSDYSNMKIKENDILIGLDVINYINSHSGNYKVIGNIDTLLISCGDADATKIPVRESYIVKVEDGNWVFSIQKE